MVYLLDVRKGEKVTGEGRGECSPTLLERETGFEPATDGLGSRCATTALLPLCAMWIIAWAARHVNQPDTAQSAKETIANRFLPTLRRYS